MTELAPDTFTLYLVGFNIVTFAVFALRIVALRRSGVPGDGSGEGRYMCVFAVAGGSVGMLLALMLFARCRMNKQNVAWWYAAFLGLVVWGGVCAWRYGWIPLDLNPQHLLTGYDVGRLKVLGVYLLTVNLLTLVAFVLDKNAALSKRSRIPEGFLLALCLVGGSPGGMLGMRVARHKTKRWYFTLGLPLMLVVQVAAFAFAHAAGLV